MFVIPINKAQYSASIVDSGFFKCNYYIELKLGFHHSLVQIKGKQISIVYLFTFC